VKIEQVVEILPLVSWHQLPRHLGMTSTGGWVYGVVIILSNAKSALSWKYEISGLTSRRFLKLKPAFHPNLRNISSIII
jgi:hypothetical protein